MQSSVAAFLLITVFHENVNAFFGEQIENSESYRPIPQEYLPQQAVAYAPYPPYAAPVHVPVHTQAAHHPVDHRYHQNFPFLGYIDPLIIIAIIAVPVLGFVGFTSLIMPLIPIAIYLFTLFFPIGGNSGKRRKRSYNTSLVTHQIENLAFIVYEAIEKYI